MCGFCKGMGLGLVLGACVGAVMISDSRRGKKMVNRAVRGMGDMVDRVSDALGM